jgi:hypothetical protein
LPSVEEISMTKPTRLNAQALATELSKLPQLTASTASNLDPVRLALARAVASGQDADQLAASLSLPAGWSGIDLSKPPPVAASTAITPASKPAPEQVTKAATPEWVTKVAPLAVASTTTTRVVVLDREPTALAGLELPAWARALSPSAVYGPLTAIGTGLQLQTPKWIIVFNFTETVEIVRGGVVLAVVPISKLQLIGESQANILSGSAWIAAHPFVATAPADSFAGLTIQSGEISSNHPLTFANGTVTIAAGAEVTLTLVPAPSAAGPANFPAKIQAPGAIKIVFPATGDASIAFDRCAGQLYGETIKATATHLAAEYNTQLKLLYIPGHTTVTTFKPKKVTGKLLTLSGAAPIASAGWALSVSESATPATLGTASGSGDFAIVFGKGIGCKWTGSSRIEPAAAGSVIAQNNALLVTTISGAAPNVLLEQKFQLWNDQDSTSGNRCQLVSARNAGQLLTYALAGTSEILELGAILDAHVDRPLLATGARVPAVFLEGVVALIHNNAGNRLIVYSATPLRLLNPVTQQPLAFPMALDNAILDVSQPIALLLSAKADAKFNTIEGAMLLLFGYLLIELYLPDPYTGGLNFDIRRTNPTVGNNPTTVDTAPRATSKADQVSSNGYLLAEVGWPTLDKVSLRLADTAHTHPTVPPTTEAGSTAVAPPPQHFFPIIPIEPILHPVVLEEKAAKPAAVTPDSAPIQPTPSDPIPDAPAGAMLLDLSTRASQLGVEVSLDERSDLQYTIDGLSVRGPAHLLPLTTLPAIAWEPMYDKSTGTADDSVDPNELLHPPNDGPFTQVRANSATLIPISPLQSLQSVLDAGTGKFDAVITLPFGMIGELDTDNINNTVLPNLTLVQPIFPASSTPNGSIYTGAWQLSISAPNPSDPDPVLAGRTYLRTESDNPYPGYSYGEQVLGVDVSDIFSSRFNPADDSLSNSTGVPLRRYDLTGYGATTFSEWTNTENPAPTDVIKAHFHVLIGRTSHEVIQVQSIVYPWAIKVVRTITIDRLASGSVERYDSGWQASSDGLFEYPTQTGITRDQIHSGLISGVINVKNIQQVGLPIATNGTVDIGSSGTSPMKIPVQPVTFDADVIIQPQHVVVQGGANLTDLTGESHVCLPSKGITGYIGLQFEYHLSLDDMANFSGLKTGAGGPISATINVGNAKSLLRATEFDATPVKDSATGGLGIACAVRGLPKLSSDGSWSVATRKQNQAAPVSLASNVSAPVVQQNKSGSSDPDTEIHFADPADIFRLAAGSATPPETLYGFLQATGTQSNFLSRPILTAGSDALKLGDAINIGHAGALLGAISKFPGISQCLQYVGSELDKITNNLAAPSLSTTQNLQFKKSVRENPFKLIDISIAQVDLAFHWMEDTDLSADQDPANVIISLGQPTDPSWELEVNRVAVTLTIPALSSDPIMWLQGGFHADADTTPSFPNLDVKFAGPLDPLTKFFTILQDIASVLSPGGGSSAQAIQAHDDGDSDGPGLNVHFSGGTLSVTDNFTLPDIPLGPGTISDVSLDIGATLDILSLTVGFGVSIGTMEAPCHWIVDPLSGTIAIGAGVKNNEIDIFILGGIGLGLAIDLGIASGSASIVIAVSIEINGDKITLMLLLTGQAQVDVLGGLASASISLTAGLGLSFDLALPPKNFTMIGTAAVGIHISICWVINISFSGSWTFQKSLPLNQLT